VGRIQFFTSDIDYVPLAVEIKYQNLRTRMFRKYLFGFHMLLANLNYPLLQAICHTVGVSSSFNQGNCKSSIRVYTQLDDKVQLVTCDGTPFECTCSVAVLTGGCVER